MQFRFSSSFWPASEIRETRLAAYSPPRLSTFLAVAGEQPIAWAICRKPAPSEATRLHCSVCPWRRVGGRSTTRFPLERARSSPSRIRSGREVVGMAELTLGSETTQASRAWAQALTQLSPHVDELLVPGKADW